MKNKTLLRRAVVWVFALLIAVFGPFLTIPVEALMSPITLDGISEYEAYFETRNPPVPINFVGYDMISCLGEFDTFRFGLKEGDTPEVHPNYDHDYSQWEYIFTDGNRLHICSCVQNYTQPIVVPTDGMQDMRSIERKDACRIRSNGLDYLYDDGILTAIRWEYAQLQFVYSFDYELVKTENGYEMIRTEEIDMSHPILGKLLSRSEQDVQEGMELLKSHMHKNGFINVTQLVWGGIALVAVAAALAALFVIRARRAKRKVASACEAPDDLKITEASE